MLKKILAVLVTLCAAAAMAAVDVNKATEAQLDSIKGIGPVTSRLLLSERKKGEFKDWADLIHRVKGIGPVRAANLSGEGLSVNGAAYKAPAAMKQGTSAVRENPKDAVPARR
jgi:competence protein ComEA